MFQGGKYGNFLTILLVVIIIAVVGLIAYFGYDVYKKYTTEQEANEFVNNFGQEIKPTDTTKPSTDGDEVEIPDDGESSLDNVDRIETGNSSTEQEAPSYQGLPVAGTIEIPATKLSYPIIAEPSKTAIEKAVAMLCGPGPNQPGNTVIIGHNYRNGKFFSNNKNLTIGDKIYITDLTGKKLSYTIYNKFETTSNDTDFIVRSTNGAREISLQTCTDDGNNRLIIVAKCDLDNN